MTTIKKVEVLWKNKTSSEEVNGIHLEWSNVNQTWFLMWKESILKILVGMEKAEAEQEMLELINV